MKVVQTIHEFKALNLPRPLGFVPTMGYLHEGHILLVKQAKAANKTVAVSIFVNPTQFGPKEDLASYPRDIPRDLAMLEKAGTDVVFIPSAAEMYPEGYDTWVEVEKLQKHLEGDSRPTHFKGVTTVVNKLFNIVMPDNAYFGQKDAQQLLVIMKMVKDLNMNLQVIACPTVREPDGLAMSSRNTYLTPEQRQAAPVLRKSLMLAKEMYDKGERDADKIRAAMIALLKTEPQGQIDYVSIADTGTLNELKIIKGQALVSLAVKIGKPRLIDNIILG
ncbi:MAG: pantoate--beta-alanine ligase [Dehalococcoidales bacterium]|nr:pantoate--beta-alanine ligase [Dehalococcoidales bacterium]